MDVGDFKLEFYVRYFGIAGMTEGTGGVVGVCGAYLLKSYRMTASVAMPEHVTHLLEVAIRCAP